MAAPSSNATSQWPNLPSDMVNDLADRRLDVFSTSRLAAVCRPYAMAIEANPALPFGKPCLLKSRDQDSYDEYQAGEDELGYTHGLHHVPTNRWDSKTFPAVIGDVRRHIVDGRYWAGANGGWLATVDLDCTTARLVNPYNGNLIDLPPITAIPGLVPIGTHGSQRPLLKIVVCETPSVTGGGYLVVALFTGAVLAVARGGDQSWTVLNNPPEVRRYNDVIAHKGKVFAVDDLYDGRMYAWDLNDASGEPEMVAPPQDSHGGYMYRRNLAVSADGDRLMLVFTTTNHDFGPYNDESYDNRGVYLYELAADDGWRRVTSLGGRALLLGANYPLLASVSPDSQYHFLRPNWVYIIMTELFQFTEPLWDVVMFDLDGLKRDGTHVCDYRHNTMQVPMWFKPTLPAAPYHQ